MSIIHSKRKYHYYSKIDQTLPNKCKLTPQSRRKFMKFIWEGNTKKSIYYGGFETGRRGRKVRSKKVNTKAKVVESVTWKTCATTAEGSTNVCFLYKQVIRISRTEKIIVSFSFSATQNLTFAIMLINPHVPRAGRCSGGGGIHHDWKLTWTTVGSHRIDDVLSTIRSAQLRYGAPARS